MIFDKKLRRNGALALTRRVGGSIRTAIRESIAT
jgi:hypothetical protein